MRVFGSRWASRTRRSVSTMGLPLSSHQLSEILGAAKMGAMPDPIDWENDDRVIVPRRPAIVIYRNLDRDIVLGLERPDG